MLRYTLRRLGLALPTLFLTVTIVFILMRMIPGDPAQLMLGDVDNPAALARIRAEYALDKPLPAQFMAWLTHVLHGDFGSSIVQGRPVLDIIGPAFLSTATLVIPAVLLAALIAIPAGTIAAWRAGTRTDAAITFMATLFLSIPSFWLGLIFLLVFGVELHLLPVLGYVSPLEDPVHGLIYLIMPVTSLGLIESGVLVRMVRASTIEVLNLDYVTHARAKGLKESTVLMRHVVRNAMAPTWTMIGLSLGALLGGAIVTESVFSVPGLGRLMVESIFARDYPVIQGCMVVIAAVYVLVNMAIELSARLFDPAAGLD